MSNLHETCANACALLDELSVGTIAGEKPTINETIKGRPPITAALLTRCDSLLFTWTLKAGLGVGYSSGQGFLLQKLDDSWSAPCFVRYTAASVGATVGLEKVSTIIVAMNKNLAKQLAAGGRSELGADVSVQFWPTAALGGGQAAPETFDLQSIGADTVDLISFSVGKGVMLDLSLKGGSLSVDAERNAAAYGSDATAAAILSGEVPSPLELQPLTERIAAIIQHGRRK